MDVRGSPSGPRTRITPERFTPYQFTPYCPPGRILRDSDVIGQAAVQTKLSQVIAQSTSMRTSGPGPPWTVARCPPNAMEFTGRF